MPVMPVTVEPTVTVATVEPSVGSPATALQSLRARRRGFKCCALPARAQNATGRSNFGGASDRVLPFDVCH